MFDNVIQLYSFAWLQMIYVFKSLNLCPSSVGFVCFVVFLCYFVTERNPTKDKQIVCKDKHKCWFYGDFVDFDTFWGNLLLLYFNHNNPLCDYLYIVWFRQHKLLRNSIYNLFMEFLEWSLATMQIQINILDFFYYKLYTSEQLIAIEYEFFAWIIW